jgi:hypothetical protein
VGADQLVLSWMSQATTPSVLNVVVRPGHAKEALSRVRQAFIRRVCVVERDAPTQAQARRVQEEIWALRDRSPLGDVLDACAGGTSTIVRVHVVIADGRAIAYAKKRWGDAVVVSGALQPVT